MNVVSNGNMPVKYDLVRYSGQQYFFPVPSVKGSSEDASYRSDKL